MNDPGAGPAERGMPGMTTYRELVRRARPVFREAARMRRTISYSELAGRAGPPLHAPHLHRQLLNALSARRRRCALPDLSPLVVRKDSGLPGAGWYGPCMGDDPDRRWAEAVEACFHFPWPVQPHP